VRRATDILEINPVWVFLDWFERAPREEAIAGLLAEVRLGLEDRRQQLICQVPA
jgi:hypothetical protein